MREITSHHDGHGLAESIRLEADDIPAEQEFGGASHRYLAAMREPGDGRPLNDEDEEIVLVVQFQKGPRKAPASTSGIIDSVLLAIVADRLECFQAGPFPSLEGKRALMHVRAAMDEFKGRADERARRGVLGKAEK